MDASAALAVNALRALALQIDVQLHARLEDRPRDSSLAALAHLIVSVFPMSATSKVQNAILLAPLLIALALSTVIAFLDTASTHNALISVLRFRELDHTLMDATVKEMGIVSQITAT